MSRRGSSSWVHLDGLTEEQVAFLIENATDWLITKATDLPKVAGDEDWKVEAEEVAALGRLVTRLRRGEIFPGDAVARRLVSRTASETDTLDELTREYRRVLGEHQAWAGLVAHFDGVPDG